MVEHFLVSALTSRQFGFPCGCAYTLGIAELIKDEGRSLDWPAIFEVETKTIYIAERWTGKFDYV